MWLPYQLSHLTSLRGARNVASKIEHNKKQQPKTQSKNNQILAAVIAHMQDARHPIHRVSIPYSKFSSPKTCHNVHENSLKIGHTRLTRFVSFSNAPMTPEGARGPLIHMRAWSSRNCMTSQTCKRRKHALTFLVFPSVKFLESLYASWYRCLLHNIIFWQNFI